VKLEPSRRVSRLSPYVPALNVNLTVSNAALVLRCGAGTIVANVTVDASQVLRSPSQRVKGRNYDGSTFVGLPPVARGYVGACWPRCSAFASISRTSCSL